MKIVFPVIALLLLSLLFACEKDSSTTDRPVDPRDSIIGIYEGFRVASYWSNESSKFEIDTLDIVIQVSKSDTDSMVVAGIMPKKETEGYIFKYSNGMLYANGYLHPPTLRIVNDSLYFYFKPGLAPRWTEWFATKQQSIPSH